MRVRPLGREDPLEWETVTHSSILAWEIPRTQSLKESDTAEHSEGLRVGETGKGIWSRELKGERVTKERSVSFGPLYQLNKGHHEVI